MYHNLRGRHMIYRNDSLAGAKRLIIFGDSFCATGSFLTLLTETFYEFISSGRRRWICVTWRKSSPTSS
jgi:hypothetical protein